LGLVADTRRSHCLIRRIGKYWLGIDRYVIGLQRWASVALFGWRDEATCMQRALRYVFWSFSPLCFLVTCGPCWYPEPLSSLEAAAGLSQSLAAAHGPQVVFCTSRILGRPRRVVFSNFLHLHSRHINQGAELRGCITTRLHIHDRRGILSVTVMTWQWFTTSYVYPAC
jgi:hypothetical protein